MRKRRGYILIAVLGLATIVTALGLSFLDSHGTAMPEAVNYYRAVRAQYVAESGVALASHFLMHPPTTSSFNDYYRGGNGIAIDGSIDFTDVVVARSDSWAPAGTDLNLYRITSVGVAHDADGTVRGKRKITTEVLVPPSAKWQIPYACFNRGSLTVPSRVSVYGDVHANGLLTGNLGSYCNGKASATSTALWFGSGSPIVQSLQATYMGPAGTRSKYTNYTINGKTYSAYTDFTKSEMTASDATSLNAIDMASTNPGRIIVCPSGDFRLRSGVELQGTLLVNGRLELGDTGSYTVRAENGFPAIIVTGDITYRRDDISLVVIGSVICGARIDLEYQARPSFNVTGSVIISNGFDDVAGNAVVRMTWDSGRSSFWDVESTPAPQPITVLSWKED